jgi:hypothetical protein
MVRAMKLENKPSSSLLSAQTNFLPLFVLVSLVLQGLLLMLTLFNTGWMIKLARKPAPTLVELTDGRSIGVEAKDALYRSTESIDAFVGQIMSLLFTASGTLAPDRTTREPRTDPGVEVDGAGSRKRVTTAAWEGSFALSKDFRAAFLRELAEMTDRGIFAGSVQTWLSIDHLSEPEPIEPGQWRLKMIATLYVFAAGDRVGKPIPVNKAIYVQAIHVPPQPLPDSATEIQRAFYQARAAGLEITRLEDISDFADSPAPKP